MLFVSNRFFPTLALAALLTTACSDEIDLDADAQQQASVQQYTYVTGQLDALVNAAVAMQSAAPLADADGWNPSADGPALQEMRRQWNLARDAYERVEALVAAFDGQSDVNVDARYDAFIENAIDLNLFDDLQVIGMHGVERILWADSHPAEVIAFESALPNYVAASYPADFQQASDFRDKLLARLVADTTALRDGYKGRGLDFSQQELFLGVLASVEEQAEKIELNATGEAESRYAGRTLADMRENLAGGTQLYDAFSSLVRNTAQGPALDDAVKNGFLRMQQIYATIPGENLPPVPATWNSMAPSVEDLATPFGQIWSAVQVEIDVANPNSLAGTMVQAGRAIGVEFPGLPQG